MHKRAGRPEPLQSAIHTAFRRDVERGTCRHSRSSLAIPNLEVPKRNRARASRWPSTPSHSQVEGSAEHRDGVIRNRNDPGRPRGPTTARKPKRTQPRRLPSRRAPVPSCPGPLSRDGPRRKEGGALRRRYEDRSRQPLRLRPSSQESGQGALSRTKAGNWSRRHWTDAHPGPSMSSRPTRPRHFPSGT